MAPRPAATSFPRPASAGPCFRSLSALLALSCTLLMMGLLPASAWAQGFNPDPEGLTDHLLVIYNANTPDLNGDGLGDSEEVARYYARRRGIPNRNLFALSCTPALPTQYFYTSSQWSLFWDECVQPLQDELSQNRNEFEIVGLVFCYGMPYRINPPNGTMPRGLDTTLMDLWDIGTRNAPSYQTVGSPNLYSERAPTFGADLGRFDPRIHLSLTRQRLYLTTRLDGLDATHAKELVDFAMYGDAYVSAQAGFYQGRAYCDTRYGKYTPQDLANYPFGHQTFQGADKDIAYGRQWMEQAGFELLWEPYGTEIGEGGARWEDGTPALTAPQAMWYSGWYNFNRYLDVWDWMVGSAASDLNSNSIARLRQTTPSNFVSHSLQKGLTCGVGCIAEPFLTGHPYTEVFQYYLMNGFTFGEASRLSDPVAKWTNLYVGDFLYQPLRAGKILRLDTQAPPPAAISVQADGTPGDYVFETYLDTTGFLPDVGRMELHHGSTPAYGQSQPAEDDRARVWHRARLSGLGPDELLHYRADYTDPVGNTGLGTPLILHTAIEQQAVLARLIGPTAIVPVGATFELESIFGAQAGRKSLTSIELTVSSTSTGWNQRDVLAVLAKLAATEYESADGTTFSYRFTVPGKLPAGDYDFEVRAVSAAGTDSSSLRVEVR